MTHKNELQEIFELAEKLVLKAGIIMLEGFSKPKMDFKCKNAFYDLVTTYDKKIEEMFVNGIKASYQNHKFIGEEQCAEAKVMPELTDSPTWIIDPIDGTTNFIKKIPHACISVALAINKEIVIGIVYNPMLNELFTARKNIGAFLNGKPILVNSHIKKISNAVVGFEISLIHAENVRDKNLKRLYKICTKATGTRCFGSAALTLCYVANGLIDIYMVDDLKPWDIAAGAIIATEAGASITDPEGKTFTIMKPNIVCASCADLCKEICGLIDEAECMNEFIFE
ncbi:uncharacterized protein LOC129616329 [Condylostylus longicornis]|uniref:uncharacterized protein LOC129616329 n=1 Tax=Condylostylus longicornis TaxID=2530218 RepID=UPI00244DC9C0|nr:uncharacterized protein LOC129616329 [Condylostylus longicornis]XP_055387916.1 uncharacterized protein LOC129616329 [Condylostylus longicornis]XP_055387917.1 uncharacterized protein LOC129616329 [Condylostylus longicornis]XP_055387918.1 uncharacterized protein LOC129616329 [Condylostylus longicornis]